MKQAIHIVKYYEISVCKAAEEYEIPKTTLQNYIKKDRQKVLEKGK